MHHVITYLLVGVSVWQDDVWGNAVLLKEANAISVELKKKVKNLICLFSTYRNRTCKYTDGEMSSRVYSRRSQQRLTDISFTALTLHISSCFNRAEHTTLPACPPARLSAPSVSSFMLIVEIVPEVTLHHSGDILAVSSSCCLYQTVLRSCTRYHYRQQQQSDVAQLVSSFSLHDALDVLSDFDGFSLSLFINPIFIDIW